MKPPRLVFSLLLAGAGALAASPAADSAPANPAVDAIFADYATPASPGCALGVIRDGDFVYRRGYGMANLEYGIPLDPQSVFRIASTSKQFTAMAVALLAESGQLGLDDPVSRWFPEFPGWAQNMTVRQLVLHTSGIRDYLELAFLAGKSDDADYYDDEWVLELLARQRETNFPPGEQFLYSNSGYLLLAHLVKRASGQTLREFAQARIFGPLGMDDTHFHDDHGEIVPRRASGYAPEGDAFRISMTTLDLVGDGGVFTTIDDLLAWDRNFYANRLGGGQKLIERMVTPGRLSDGEALDYAFGLDIGSYRGLRSVSHGGAFVGFRAELLRFPDASFSVAVLCNRSDAAPDALARRVADRYLEAEFTAESSSAAPLADGAAPGETLALDERLMHAYAGDYWEDREAFAAEIRFEDGRLWAVHSPERRNELVPVAPDVLEMTGMPARVLVYLDRQGDRITGMRTTADGEALNAFRPFERRRASAAELAQYEGEYYSAELDVSYQLRADRNLLLFDVPGHRNQALTPMFDETFENPHYGAFEFHRAPDGRVIGFRLQSGRVRNLAFTRR